MFEGIMKEINTLKPEIKKNRKNEFPVHALFMNRWSPRAMSGEAITKEELMSLFEAARWAPSSNNNQHWRFVYALRGSEHWNRLFNLLAEGNQQWCKNAAALVVIISKDTSDYNGRPMRTHSFDAGSAWENLALQGTINGLVVHGMGGFDYDQARNDLNVPEGYTVEAMCAVGKPGKKEDLPPELQERETPSDRKNISEIVSEGAFNFD